MVEHDRRAAIARFYVAEVPAGGGDATLRGDIVRHMHVLRLRTGARVSLLDGAGRVALGALGRLDAEVAMVELHEVQVVPRPPAVHMLVPVGDRERMLWLAEKCTELAATSWRPVQWNRSASVSHRGEGAAFETKIKARMVAAAAQSGNAWLPTTHRELRLSGALDDLTPGGTRLLLDRDGTPIAGRGVTGYDAPVTLALGPEGGLEDDERAALEAAGFAPVSLSHTILRFETAGVAGLAVVRALVGES